MKILGIIPARYGSTRFHAKALAEIHGKPMVQHVYERSSESLKLDEVIVATDHAKIFDVVKSFGGRAVMTREDHPSGTDRCYEAFLSTGKNFDYIINIQGDEPFIKPEQIDECAGLLDGKVELATMVTKIKDTDALFSPNTAKVLLNQNGEAIYFSREALPHLRGIEKKNYLDNHTFYKHVSIYAYRSDVLKAITSLKPSPLEEAEKLEQLRWIENGYKIKVGVTEYESFGIDTEEDLKKAIKHFSA